MYVFSRRAVSPVMGEIAALQGVRFIPSSPLLGLMALNTLMARLTYPILFIASSTTPSINRNSKKPRPSFVLDPWDISAPA